MKLRILFSIAAFALAHPATAALTITNLDKVPHKVLVESQGSNRVVDIAPDETEYVTSFVGGYISLISAEEIRRSNARVNADGILSGVFAGERNQGIPADEEYSYAIWPGGKLGPQKRRNPGSLH